jgi:hypothetical protein
MLTTCNAIFCELLGIQDKRTKKSAASCERFASLNANLELEAPTNTDDLIDGEYDEPVTNAADDDENDDE